MSSKMNLRLWELNQEWDLGKTQDINASTAIVTGMMLGTVGYKNGTYSIQQ